jgi:hypothetical protein
MTHSSTPEAAIAGVTEAARGLRAALTARTDSNLTTGILALDAAVGRLSTWEQEWHAAPPTGLDQRAQIHADIEALRRELRALEPVVRHGEEFLRGWARILGLDTGYTANGMPGGVETAIAAPHMDVEG